MTRYDTIGKQYSQTRQSDPRIVKAIIEYLKLTPPAVLADIGAGTGNYTNAVADHGFEMIAIEPSKTMQLQALPHKNVTWKTGCAENLPLNDNQVDGLLVTLALHHFNDPKQAFKEMARVCQGPLVFFTCDPRLAQDFWLFDYFASFYEDACKLFPSIETMTTLLGETTAKHVTTYSFALPADLKDKFLAAIWQTPEIVLDPAYRRSVSSFSLGDQTDIQIGVEKLKADLESGAWHNKYRHYLKQQTYDAGYRFVVAR